MAKKTPDTEPAAAPAVDPDALPTGALDESVTVAAPVEDDGKHVVFLQGFQDPEGVYYPIRVDGGEKAFMVQYGGQHYVHVGESGDTWVYRKER